MKKKDSITPTKTPDLESVMEDRATTLQRIGETLQGAAPNKTKTELMDDINEVLTLTEDEAVNQEIKDMLAEVGGKSLKRKTKDELIDIWNYLKTLDSDSPMARSLGGMLKMASRGVKSVDTNIEKQLNNIDFANLIGGPMQAAIRAQADAATSTINFIKEVGFYEEGTGEDKVTKLHYVDFSYEKQLPTVYDRNEDGSIKKDGDGKPIVLEENPTETKKIKVPLLTMLTIPSIRIDSGEIDFNAKLNSVEEAKKSDKLGVKLDAKAKFGPVRMKVTASYQRASSHGVKVAKEYSMHVNIKFSQDELPAGLEKVLNLLE